MFEDILRWGAPPVLGAAIGFLTNALAIRMLFRPLTKKRLFGVPLPLTPGIIPRRRHELSRSIAQMVSRELLSADAVRTRLQSETFREALQRQISELRRGLLARPLAELVPRPTSADGDGTGGGTGTGTGNADGPAAAAANVAAPTTVSDAGPLAWEDLVRLFLEQSLGRLFRSRGFIYTVRGVVERFAYDLGDRPLGEVVDLGRVAALAGSKLGPVLQRPELRQQLGAAIKGWLHEQWQQQTRISTFVTDETVELLVSVFRRSLPPLLHVLFEWLREPEVHYELELRGRAILRDVLDKLNLMQKVFITAGQYDRTLHDRMPDIVTDVIDRAERATETDEVQDQITDGARRALQRWRSGTLADLSQGAEGTADEVVDVVVGRVLDSLAGSDPQRVEQTVGDLLRSSTSVPLRELAARYFGLQVADVVDAASNNLLGYLSREDTARELAALIPQLVKDGLGDTGATTLGDLLPLPDRTAAQLDRFLVERLIAVLAERVPAIIATLDIETLVVTKIDSLDVLDVERLLLQVIAQHLKWINLFGALIGGLIGFSQLALRALP